MTHPHGTKADDKAMDLMTYANLSVRTVVLISKTKFPREFILLKFKGVIASAASDAEADTAGVSRNSTVGAVSLAALSGKATVEHRQALSRTTEYLPERMIMSNKYQSDAEFTINRFKQKPE